MTKIYKTVPYPLPSLKSASHYQLTMKRDLPSGLMAQLGYSVSDHYKYPQVIAHPYHRRSQVYHPLTDQALRKLVHEHKQFPSTVRNLLKVHREAGGRVPNDLFLRYEHGRVDDFFKEVFGI